MAMDPKIIQKVSSRIYRQFPEVAGAAPRCRSLSTPSSTTGYVLTYQGKAAAAGGKSISRIVRVTVDENGKIIKITTSR
jgi:hypothetical protein